MQKYLIKNINVVNEGRITTADVLFANERIEKIAPTIETRGDVSEIRGEGKYLLPGAIDDQVHFREPGLTHKANIFSESRAAVAGGEGDGGLLPAGQGLLPAALELKDGGQPAVGRAERERVALPPAPVGDLAPDRARLGQVAGQLGAAGQALEDAGLTDMSDEMKLRAIIERHTVTRK